MCSETISRSLNRWNLLALYWKPSWSPSLMGSCIMCSECVVSLSPRTCSYSPALSQAWSTLWERAISKTLPMAGSLCTRGCELRYNIGSEHQRYCMFASQEQCRTRFSCKEAINSMRCSLDESPWRRFWTDAGQDTYFSWSGWIILAFLSCETAL